MRAMARVRVRVRVRGSGSSSGFPVCAVFHCEVADL